MSFFKKSSPAVTVCVKRVWYHKHNFIEISHLARLAWRGKGSDLLLTLANFSYIYAQCQLCGNARSFYSQLPILQGARVDLTPIIFIKMGMPARYEDNRWIAHTDNIDEFFRQYTKVWWATIRIPAWRCSFWNHRLFFHRGIRAALGWKVGWGRAYLQNSPQVSATTYWISQ